VFVRGERALSRARGFVGTCSFFTLSGSPLSFKIDLNLSRRTPDSFVFYTKFIFDFFIRFC